MKWCFIYLIIPFQSMSQLACEYYLTGVHEMGSGFNLKSDSTFEFYYSYGAVDRYAEGTWTMKDGKVVLNSNPGKGGFILTHSEQKRQNGVVVKIVEANKQVLPYTVIAIEGADGNASMNADQEGYARFKKQKVNTISLQHQIWVNAPQVFTVDHGMNYFEFHISPEIMKVEIKDLTLMVEDGGLRGMHPLLDGKEYLYIKE